MNNKKVVAAEALTGRGLLMQTPSTPEVTLEISPSPAKKRGEKMSLSVKSKRRNDIALRTSPLAAACALIGLAVFIEPGVIVGSVLLAAELTLGGFSIYQLWPKG